MESLKDQLKKFITGCHMNHDVTYLKHYALGEHVEFGITSRTNNEYFFADSVNGEKSIRAYYRLAGMKEDSTIVAEFTDIKDNSCEILFRSLDQMKIQVKVDSNRRVSICLL